MTCVVITATAMMVVIIILGVDSPPVKEGEVMNHTSLKRDGSLSLNFIADGKPLFMDGQAV